MGLTFLSLAQNALFRLVLVRNSSAMLGTNLHCLLLQIAALLRRYSPFRLRDPLSFFLHEKLCSRRSLSRNLVKTTRYQLTSLTVLKCETSRVSICVLALTFFFLARFTRLVMIGQFLAFRTDFNPLSPR